MQSANCLLYPTFELYDNWEVFNCTVTYTRWVIILWRLTRHSLWRNELQRTVNLIIRDTRASHRILVDEIRLRETNFTHIVLLVFKVQSSRWFVLKYLFPIFFPVWRQYDSSSWSSVSFEARNLINRMLTRHPNQRITAKEALRHPWIQVS